MILEHIITVETVVLDILDRMGLMVSLDAMVEKVHFSMVQLKYMIRPSISLIRLTKILIPMKIWKVQMVFR